MDADAPTRWLLLLHQIPPKPSYFRVKIWRRLQRMGAVALRNAVYALPCSEAAHEQLQWVLREIVAGGGEATICEARFVDGLSDAQIEGLFRSAREEEYGELAVDARKAATALRRRKRLDAAARTEVATELARLERRLADIVDIDHFGAPGRAPVQALLQELGSRVRAGAAPAATTAVAEVRGRTWVTRTGIHVDRIASAWLIRRSIDPDARFAFVAAKGYRPRPGELRFDMYEAEYTHEGDRCTFEVLLQRFGLRDPALAEIGEVVHDLDLGDGKFARADAEGIGRLVAGICLAHRDDETRLERGAAVLEDLYRYYQQKQRTR